MLSDTNSSHGGNFLKPIRFHFPEFEYPKRTMIAIVLLFAVILVAPWFTGLFFLPASAFVAAAVLLLSLIVFRFKGRSWGVADPRTFAMVLAFYIALSTLWSASLITSIPINVVQISALLFFVIMVDYAKHVRKAAVYAILLIGVALYFFGMGAAFSWWPAVQAVYDGNMLASVFQYHNTFAAIELAIGVIGYLYGMSHRRWWLNALGALSFVLSLSAVLGSQSRTVWVLMVFALVAVLIIRAVVNRSVWSAITGILLIIVGVASGLLAIQALTHIKPWDFVLSTVIAVVASFALALWDRWILQKKVSKKGIYAGAIVFLVLVALALYKLRAHLFSGSGSVSTRLQSITFHSISLQERFYYYKNALHMWMNAPIFGSSGGTWTAKFQAFQTLPYWSEQVHSSFFDQLLNFGVFGFLLTLVLIALCVWGMVKAVRNTHDRKELLLIASYIVAVTVLSLHSLLDFDFAYGYFQYLFVIFLAFAAHVAPDTEAQAKQLERTKTSDRSTVISRGLLTTGTVLVAVLAFTLSLSIASAQAILGQSSTTVAPVSNNASTLQAALQVAPYNPSLQIADAQQMMQTAQATQNRSLYAKAWQHIQTAHALAPWDPALQTQAAVMAYELGQGSTAVAWAQEAHQDGAFNTPAFRNLLGLSLWTAAAQLKTNPVVSRSMLQQVLSQYQAFEVKSKDVNMHLFPDSVVMTMDASMQVYAATADYLLGDYAQSLKVMTPLSTTNRDIAAVSLYETDKVLDDAALHQTGKIDQLLLKQLSANPSAMQQYNYLKSL